MQAASESTEWDNRQSGTRPLPSTGSVIAGRYRLDEIIGRGGMATVWRSHDQRLGRDVAVKICPSNASGAPMTIGEEQAASDLQHPNIVSIFDAGEIVVPDAEAASTFIVMEYVRGTNAQQIAPVPWREAVRIVRQAADGLSAAHERGIVHCDVKPGNLLIDQRGRVLVADFGIAITDQSEPGEFVHGSSAYIAPERLNGERASPRVDVYGLGGVLAFLITGQRPAEDIVSLPLDCPSEVGNLIARARLRDPHQRYADASAFRDALDRVVGSATVRRRSDTVIAERPFMPGGERLHPTRQTASSRRVIRHPAHTRPTREFEDAQQTAAMSPSAVRISMPPDCARIRHRARRSRIAALIAAGCLVVLLVLVAVIVVREIVSIERATPRPAPVAAVSTLNVVGLPVETVFHMLAGPADPVLHPSADAPASG